MKRKMISLLLQPWNEPEHQSDAPQNSVCLSKLGGSAPGGESLGLGCLPLGMGAQGWGCWGPGARPHGPVHRGALQDLC